MYNRYIPQDDGSYFKNRIPDAEPKKPPTPPPVPDHRPPPPKNHKPPSPEIPPLRQSISAGSFLRQLLPKDIDTGDLLIIVLLLLIAGDGSDNNNTALLTLALYLFL